MVRTPSTGRSAVLSAALEPSHDGAYDRLLAWMGVYIPTYGTSVAFHAAAILLLMFMVMTGPPAEIPPQVHAGVVPDHKVLTEKRPQQVEREPQWRGHLEPTPNSIALGKIETPDVAPNDLDPLRVIGIKGGGRDLGKPGGWGKGPVFGRPGDKAHPEGVRKIVYVVDRSGSMTDAIDIVKMELKRSIAELDDSLEFHVIFYSTGPAVEMPTRRLVPATARNKELAAEFIDQVVAMGETDPSRALERAFAVRPDLIYLLTDGEFDRSVVGLAKRLNTQGRVRVDTIAFLYRVGEDTLRRIADENGGQYKFVSEAQVALLGG